MWSQLVVGVAFMVLGVWIAATGQVPLGVAYMFVGVTALVYSYSRRRASKSQQESVSP